MPRRKTKLLGWRLGAAMLRSLLNQRCRYLGFAMRPSSFFCKPAMSLRLCDALSFFFHISDVVDSCLALKHEIRWCLGAAIPAFLGQIFGLLMWCLLLNAEGRRSVAVNDPC